MKRYLLTVFLFTSSLLSYPVFAQLNKTVPVIHVIDSLRNVLKTEKEDTNKVRTLNELSARHEIVGNYDSSLIYAQSAKTLAEKIAFKKGVAEALMETGNVYHRQANDSEAIRNYSKALSIQEDIGDKKGIAESLQKIGRVYDVQGDYVEALKNFMASLKICEELEDKNTIATLYNNIGGIYDEQGNEAEALKKFMFSMKTHEELGDKSGMALAYNSVGNIYNHAKIPDYPQALKNYMTALKIYEELESKGQIAMMYNNIGTLYYFRGNYDTGLTYFLASLRIHDELGDKMEISACYNNIGGTYVKLKKFTDAETYLNKGLLLAKELRNKRRIRGNYEYQTELYEGLGDWKKALDFYKLFSAMNDSLINDNINNQLYEMEISYGFEKKADSVKAEYEQESIIKTAEIKRKKILNEGAIIILVLTALLAASLISRQQIKRKKDKLFFEKELANSKAILEDYVKNMAEKNRLLEQFKIDLENMEQLKAKEIDENRIERLEHLNKTTILTEEDWDKFKELFEQVYKGFFIHLKEKLPDLTQAEIRLICLIKLKLNAKEMSGILGVSSATVKQTRYRLRKKLDLPEGDSIDDIVESI